MQKLFVLACWSLFISAAATAQQRPPVPSSAREIAQVADQRQNQRPVDNRGADQCTEGICLDEEITRYRTLDWKIKADQHEHVSGSQKCVLSLKNQLSQPDAIKFCQLSAGDVVSVELMNFVATKNPVFCAQSKKSNDFFGTNGRVRVFASVAKDGKLRVSSIIKYYEFRDMGSVDELARLLKEKHPYMTGFNDETNTPWGGTAMAMRFGTRVEYSIHANRQNYSQPTNPICKSDSAIRVY